MNENLKVNPDFKHEVLFDGSDILFYLLIIDFVDMMYLNKQPISSTSYP